MAEQTKAEISPVASSKVTALRVDGVNWIAIGPDADGQRVDNYLARVAKGVPKSHLYRIIRGGEVRVNKARVKAETKLAEGDLLRVPPMRVSQKAANKPAAVPLAKGTVPVLYEDRHLLVVNKPAGIAAHGGSGISHGLIERLRASYPDEPFLELAHRLDRETSGAIIVCKTRKALVRLHDMMKEGGGIEKHYRLLVRGDWVNDRQHVRAPLLRYLLPSGERRVRVDAKEGVFAHTIFTMLSRFGDVTYLDAELRTGRTHQIRVHALSEGHPLVGDDKYGDFDFNREVSHGLLGLPFKRMFLHAHELRFVHPVTGEPLQICAPMPEECQALIDTLTARGWEKSTTPV